MFLCNFWFNFLGQMKKQVMLKNKTTFLNIYVCIIVKGLRDGHITFFLLILKKKQENLRERLAVCWF